LLTRRSREFYVFPNNGAWHNDRHQTQTLANRDKSLILFWNRQSTWQKDKVRPDLGHIHFAQHVC
jgi:hypothetical protein